MTSPSFALTLFGPFEARYKDRSLTDFATDKIRALLAYLAVESGKPHRRETLAGLLWPDYPDDVSLRNLRQSLYRLRQTLQDADSSLAEQLLIQTRQTVTLNAGALFLDTAEFSQLLHESKTTADPTPLLNQVTDLYQGELLAGFSVLDAYAFDEWLSIQRELFHQKAVEALSRLIALHESNGDPDAVLSTSARLLSLDPWHEKTHRQIMHAHLNKGNRAQAIAQYNELKAILLRDLGVEPASDTQALYKQIRTDTAVVTADDVAASRPSQPHQPTLPASLTPFIGRKPELEYLTERLQDPACRLLTITGSGGMGKTRLGIETIRLLAGQSNRFTSGTLFFPLAQIEDSNLLITTIAQSLGLSFQQNADPRQELLNHLKTKNLLLFLDNFEHLMVQAGDGDSPAAVSFLVETLASAPGVTFLVTSRDPLMLKGEWVYPLKGLPYTPDNGESGLPSLDLPAPQLFIQNARRYQPAFDATAQAGDILEICRLTDGLPLAMEIAAAWMRAYDCREIAQRIAQSLDFLTSPYQDAPARQRSIRAVFVSTWNQLAPEQQSVLAAMSVFRGGFTVPAALSVAQASVLDLAILVEKSLLRRVGDGRFELHELVRQFAAEKLVESGEEQAVQARHADFFFTFLSEQIPGFNGPNPQETVATVRKAMDNFRAAWQWAVAHGQVSLLEQVMDGFGQFLMLTSSGREGEEAFEKALNALQQTGQSSPELLSVQSRLASRLAWFQSGLGKHQATLENAVRAVALADQAQDASSRAYGLSILGWTLQTQGEYDEAEAALLEAVALFNETGNPLQASVALIRLGSIYWRKGDFEKTLEYYQESLQIEKRLHNKRGINRAYGGIGLVYKFLDKYDEALEWLNKALVLDRELGNQFGVARHLGNIGSTYYDLGDYQQALASYQEAAKIEKENEHMATLAVWLGSIGNVYNEIGEQERALEYYDQAIVLGEELEDRFYHCEALLGKGEVFLQRGEYGRAKALIEQGRRLADEVQRKEIQFDGRLLEARLLAKTGNPKEARQHLKTMLANLDEEEKSENLAQLYYELWRIENEAEYAHQALAAYQAALSRAPKGKYRQRIEELNSFLSGRRKVNKRY